MVVDITKYTNDFSSDGWTTDPAGQIVTSGTATMTWKYDEPMRFSEAAASVTGAPTTVAFFGSYDGVSWYELGPRVGAFTKFRDDAGNLLAGDVTFTRFMLRVDGTGTTVSGVSIMGDIEVSTEELLEQKYFDMFPVQYRAEYPLLPSLVKTYLTMLRDPEQ